MGVDINKKKLGWSEPLRLQLIEAVIKVKSEEAMMPSNGGGLSRSSFRRLPIKWSRVAKLLPIEFRGKFWNRRKQKYSGTYKCNSTFSNLLRAFRVKSGQISKGSSSKIRRAVDISESEFKMLSKFDDLPKPRCTVPAETNSKSQSGNTEDEDSSNEGSETEQPCVSSSAEETGESMSLQGHMDDVSLSEGQDRPVDKGERAHIEQREKSIEKNTWCLGVGSASKSTSESSKYVKVKCLP